LELILKSIVQGIVEGVTEFLPISSTGHMIIVGHFINFTGPFARMFEVFIQLGAILAVIVYYRKKILDSATQLMPGQSGFALWSRIVVAFLPAAVIGFMAKDIIEAYLFSPYTVGVALIVGAILMLVVERLSLTSNLQQMEQLTYKQALIIGLAQCLALLPGMSRSASTIIGGMLVGMTLTAAAEFSFFLAIPTMLGATTLSLIKGLDHLTADEWLALAVGFAVSFFTAMVVIDKFLGYLARYSLKPFAYYRLVVGIFIVIFFYGPAIT
jgi:undecaprenyl-diphosphatase